MSRNDLPNEKAPNFNARLRETLMTYLGKSGDPLDRGITLRDLLDSGLTTLDGAIRGGGVIPLAPGPALSGVIGSGTTTEPDLTPPPTPTGFEADTGITTIIMTHDTPLYTQGHGHLRTHVYGAIRASEADPAPTFSDAAEIMQFSGTVASYSTNPATTWHLWIKWESVDGVLSASPAGGTNGVIATTGQDVQKLLDALTGQLTEQQLYKDLGDRINLIDGPLTMAGSVAAQIYAETQARLAADTTLGSSITTLTNTTNSQATAITTLQTKSDTAASNIISLQNTTASQATTISSLSTTVGNHTSSITSLNTTTANQATSITNLNTTVGSHTSSITSLQQTTANQATSITQVSAAVKGASYHQPLDQWTLNGQSIVTLSDGKVGSTALRLSGIGGAYPNQGNFIAINPGKKYRVRFWARPSSNATGVLYFSLRQFTADNASSPGPVNGGRSPYKPSGQSRSAHISTYGDTWGEYNYVWSASDWQTGVKFFQPEFLDNYSGAAGYWDIQGFTIYDVTDVENVSASVQVLAQATAGPDGATAQYTVKLDTNGYVAGFGLSSTANAAGVGTSTFAIRADSFYIASPSGPGITPAMPFIVRTTATTINGVSVPVGVYMTDAFIQNGTITNAKIGNAAIDDAKIASLDASKITTGYLSAARIQAGSLDAKIANLDAAVITSGYISSARINSASIANATIDAAQITSGTISSARIGSLTVTNANITDGTISAAKIDKATISNLSALSADLGTITAGTAKFALDASNYIIIDGPNQRIDVYSAGLLRVRLGKL